MNGWFLQSMTLEKSDGEDDKKINVKIIASAATPDREDELISLKAYDQETTDDFLKQGIIDYDHKSFMGKSSLEKAEAIIGQPTDFQIENKKPVVYGFLFKANPYVKNSILPALEAGSKVFGASWGGRKLKKSSGFVKEYGKNLTVIEKVALNHLAVCPFFKAVHQGTAVSLMKSMDECEFQTFEEFVKSYKENQEFSKALMAGTETDIAKVSGGQALQKQSLEGGISKHIFSALNGLRSGLIKGNYDSLVLHFVKSGLDLKKAEEMAKYIAANSSKIATQLKSR